MSDTEHTQNNNNNIDNENENKTEEEEAVSEEELNKEIEDAKKKLRQLYAKQWNLKVQKYKEWKQKQQEKNNDNDNDQAEKCEQMGCHGWRHGGWGHCYPRCSPYYRWWLCSQRKEQQKDGCKDEHSNPDEKQKENEKKRNECQRKCPPCGWWWFWAQKRRQMQNQQEKCPNSCGCEWRKQYPGQCQSPCNEWRKRHCCHPHHHCSPQMMWWIWAQRQRQMQQQQQWYPNWYGCEWRKQCPGQCQSPCNEWRRRHCCHQNPQCSPQMMWWIWAQRQRQMQQQQQWQNWYGCEWRKQCPGQCQSPCDEWRRRHCCHQNPQCSPRMMWWIWAKRHMQHHQWCNHMRSFPHHFSPYLWWFWAQRLNRMKEQQNGSCHCEMKQEQGPNERMRCCCFPQGQCRFFKLQKLCKKQDHQDEKPNEEKQNQLNIEEEEEEKETN